MSQDYVTVIKCSNAEVVKVCASVLKCCDACNCEKWKDGDTDLKVTTINHIPLGKIEVISTLFPGDVINYSFSSDCEGYSVWHTGEYHNGEPESVGIEPGYMRDIMELDNKEDGVGIFEKAYDFYRKLDPTKTDKDGNMFINWYPEEVNHKFEYDGSEGKRYRVETRKLRNHMAFKILAAKGVDEWQVIHDGSL